MYNCIVKYSSKISGQTSRYKSKGTLNTINGKTKLSFSLESGQNFSLFILNDGGVRLISEGESNYSILFKNQVDYPFFISLGAFEIDASANTKLVKTIINESRLEVSINYIFTCGKEQDHRTIKIIAEVI